MVQKIFVPIETTNEIKTIYPMAVRDKFPGDVSK
jgi:hypothetical protein